MKQKNTSTQHLPSPLLDGAGRTMGGSGDVFEGVPVPTVVNETKLGIVAFMRDLSRPVTAGELFSLLDRAKRLDVLDYHLCTLVRAGVAKMVSGPELRFVLANLGESTGFQGRCH
jgi:hypothetical protein